MMAFLPGSKKNSKVTEEVLRLFTERNQDFCLINSMKKQCATIIRKKDCHYFLLLQKLVINKSLFDEIAPSNELLKATASPLQLKMHT